MEWKTVKISDIATIINGGTPKTPVPEYWGGDIPWLSVKDFNNDLKYVESAEKSITNLGLENSATNLLHRDDVIISARGTVGVVSMIARDMAFNQSCFGLRAKNFDAHYLYYLLKESVRELQNQSQGSVFDTIVRATFDRITCNVPISISDQRRIASILSSLDAQIENNNRINRNLEEQAAALFKSWFVDFEPWGGKMPEDWKERKYIDIIEKTVSGDWGKEKAEGKYTHGVACVRGCDFEDIKNGMRGKTPRRYILEKNYQSKHLLPQDVLVEISGGTATVSTGRVCLVSKELLDQYENNIVCTNFCKVIRPMQGYSAYLFYSWIYKYKCKVMFGYENGTSGIKNFAIVNFIEKEPVIVPAKEDTAKFQEIIDILYAKIQENGKQSARLATLRDTLLPKLMKGEIEV